MDCKNCVLRDDCEDGLKDKYICDAFERVCCGNVAMIKEVCWNGIQLTCMHCHKEYLDFDTREPGDWFWGVADTLIDLEGSLPILTNNRED